MVGQLSALLPVQARWVEEAQLFPPSLLNLILRSAFLNDVYFFHNPRTVLELPTCAELQIAWLFLHMSLSKARDYVGPFVLAQVRLLSAPPLEVLTARFNSSWCSW